MKIRTINDLQDSIDAEMAWRKHELTAIRENVVNSRKSSKDTAIRAGIALLYAHWEGAIKNIATYYLEYISALKLPYGVLKPMDGVTPYRLEMQAKAKVAGTENLYEYWKDALYREVRDDSGVIINLASKEYSRCIEKYMQSEDRFITCIFGELEGGRVVQKGVYAKMARGDMVRFMAEHQIEDPEMLKTHDRMHYHFSAERSSETEYVFIRENMKS